MKKLEFEILAEMGAGRVGKIRLNGVEVTTPIFMPVGTRATIKGILLDLLRDPHFLPENAEPIKIILANTFHLFLRPGDELIRDAGGLHEFMQRKDGLILTDSGGFQVFSLGLKKSETGGTKVQEAVKLKFDSKGVAFRSPHDGSKHFFSPEGVVDIQANFGSDIMMMLDVCTPATDDKKLVAKQLKLTHERAEKARNHYSENQEKIRGVLFPIVQGGIFEDLREESLRFLERFATDGIAVGGVSVGETREKIWETVNFIGPKLPREKPRYLMGVGTPEDLKVAIEAGFDMFDCVQATRLGRHGVMFSERGNVHISRAEFRRDFSPLSDLSPGLARFSKAYVHHLIRENEILGGTLLGLHNIFFLHKMLTDWKKSVLAGE